MDDSLCMEEQDIVFSRAVSDFNGGMQCRIRAFSPDALMVLCFCMDKDCPPLVLGRAAFVLPDCPVEITGAEKRELGLPAEADDDAGEVYCRVGIPADHPDLAGFDMAHLVFVSRKTGRAMEAERPGMPFVSLKSLAAKFSREGGKTREARFSAISRTEAGM